MARQNDHNRAEELISAYLDKRVSADEKDFFERHIASCADCRAQLEATRSMVAALRAMPVVKAPRSFVLPREMAKESRRSFISLYPALRLATVVAALTFVVLFAGDLLINRSGAIGASQSIPAAARAPALRQAPGAQPAAAPTTAPAAAEASNAAATAPVAPAAPTTAPAALAAPGAGAAAKSSATAIVTESPALSPTTATPEGAAAADASLQAQSLLSATSEPTKPAATQQTASAAAPPVAANVVEVTPAIDPLRTIEIAVLVLAIVLGIATLVARRKQM